MERHADKKTDATDLRNKLVDEVKKSHGQIQTGTRMTFNDLAVICEKNFYQPAEFAEGRKISGVRSVSTATFQLGILKKFFGKRPLREITTESIFDYKRWRLKTNSKRTGEPVKISTINRELSTMRKMMRFAFGKGWTLRDIFFNAKAIDASFEIERHRILTLDEELRLLNSCSGTREIIYQRNGKEVAATISVDNPFLKAMIVLALDSAMRLGEIQKMRWTDIDFDNGIITVLATNTKTERERLAPLSERARTELEKLKEIAPGENPFPYKDIKRSFATAKKLAKIDDLHFHDLRRTAITRWIQQGTPLALAGKLGGHTQLQTTMKHYTSNDAASVKEITERMNNFHSQIEANKEIFSETIN
ncbi:MAG: site-specific integrase [Pyrinomonadaceae bacterium]